MTDETTQEANQAMGDPVPVDVKSATVLAAEAADHTLDAQTAAMLSVGASTLQPSQHATLHHRMSLWARTFEQSLVHGIETAIANAHKAVEAFESHFHK